MLQKFGLVSKKKQTIESCPSSRPIWLKNSELTILTIIVLQRDEHDAKSKAANKQGTVREDIVTNWVGRRQCGGEEQSGWGKLSRIEGRCQIAHGWWHLQTTQFWRKWYINEQTKCRNGQWKVISWHHRIIFANLGGLNSGMKPYF